MSVSLLSGNVLTVKAEELLNLDDSAGELAVESEESILLDDTGDAALEIEDEAATAVKLDSETETVQPESLITEYDFNEGTEYADTVIEKDSEETLSYDADTKILATVPIKDDVFVQDSGMAKGKRMLKSSNDTPRLWDDSINTPEFIVPGDMPADLVFCINNNIDAISETEFENIKNNLLLIGEIVFRCNRYSRIYVIDQYGYLVKGTAAAECATNVINLEHMLKDVRNDPPTEQYIEPQLRTLVSDIPFRETAYRAAMFFGNTYITYESELYSYDIARINVRCIIDNPYTASGSWYDKLSQRTRGMLLYNYDEFVDDVVDFMYGSTDVYNYKMVYTDVPFSFFSGIQDEEYKYYGQTVKHNTFDIDLNDFYKIGTQYNSNWHNLTRASMCAAMSAFNVLDRKNFYDNIVEYMHSIGMSVDEINNVNYPDSSATDNQRGYDAYGKTDNVGYAIGTRKISNNGNEKTLMLVAVRGGKYQVEWGGNFRIKDPEENEKHPYDHAGFSIAADKVLNGEERDGKLYNGVRKCVEELGGKDNVIVWVVGFSRGGATANLVSARLLDDGYPNVYGFCFECPKTTIRQTYLSTPDYDPSAKYNTIINIINPTDFVTKVAMNYGKEWNYTRYGVSFSILSKYNGASCMI